MKTLDLALIDQTNASYDEFLAIGTETEEKIKRWVNKGREVGLYLQSLRENHRQWEQLALPMTGATVDDSPRLKFDEVRGRMFLRLADKLREEAATPLEAIGALKEVAILQGTLALPDGHGHQQRHTKDSLSFIITRTMEIQATFNRDVRDEIVTWGADRKQHLRDQLEPLVKIYDSLAP